MGIIHYGFISLSDSSEKGNVVNRKVRVLQDACSLFFNGQHLFIQLGSEARAFFDYLCEQMRSDTNGIIINKELKEKFIKHIGKVTGGKVKPALNSLNKYVSVFKRLGLLILDLNASREFYYVNPKYAYKGKQKATDEYLKKADTGAGKSGKKFKRLNR